MDDKDGKISWMYDGVKANVNREDYLLGKRIGKDVSALSDTIRPDDESAHQRSIDQSLTKNLTDRKSPPHGGLLTLTNIQCEDPMFGIKLAEERARRKKIDNPYLQMKLRKAINEEMEEAKKKKKKHKHHKKHHSEKHSKRSSRSKRSRSPSPSSRSSDSDYDRRKSKKRRRSDRDRR